MSYQVIARKWRPQTFDEVTGQSHVTTPLRNAIRSDRVPHAILLTGPRGTGKTTLARIMARCLNCEKGPTDTPCGTCAPCREIAEGRSTDVQEIDAASRTGVDDVREVIESIRYAASPGKHRIFVVDEVHMLSAAAFNALLKTLEEPPPRSLFIFATTNPEKIPFTVISRCQRYDLRLFATAEVTARLAEICRADGIEISDWSLAAVAREGQGSMRDAQTLLDQVIAYGGTQVSDDTVREVLDLVDRNILLAILEACIDGQAGAALEACHRAMQTGSDARRLAGALLQLLRDLTVLLVAPDEPGLVEGSDAEIAELRALAERAEPARLRRMFRALVKEQEDLAWAPQPFAVLEMALIRLTTMPRGDDVETLLGRLDQLERTLGKAGGPSGGGSGGGGGGGAHAGRAAARPAPQRGGNGGLRETRGAEAPPETGAPDGPTIDETALQSLGEADPAPPPGAPDLSAPLETVMGRLRAFAAKSRPQLASALTDAELTARSEAHVALAVSAPFLRRRLEDQGDEVHALCAEFFGRPVRVEIQARGEAAAAPGRRGPGREEPAREVERRQRRDALNHPGVNAALEILEGEIVDILPLGGKPLGAKPRPGGSEAR